MMLLLFPTMSKAKMNQKRWNPEFQLTLNHKIHSPLKKKEPNQQDSRQYNQNESINKIFSINYDNLRLIKYD